MPVQFSTYQLMSRFVHIIVIVSIMVNRILSHTHLQEGYCTCRKSIKRDEIRAEICVWMKWLCNEKKKKFRRIFFLLLSEGEGELAGCRSSRNKSKRLQLIHWPFCLQHMCGFSFFLVQHDSLMHFSHSSIMSVTKRVETIK